MLTMPWSKNDKLVGVLHYEEAFKEPVLEDFVMKNI